MKKNIDKIDKIGIAFAEASAIEEIGIAFAEASAIKEIVFFVQFFQS